MNGQPPFALIATGRQPAKLLCQRLKAPRHYLPPHLPQRSLKMKFAYSGRKNFGMRGANMRNRFGSILRKANFRVSAKQLERMFRA